MTDMQPPAAAPPAWSPPPSGGVATRPMGVTLSAVLFFVVGVLGIIAAVLVFAGGTMLEGVFGGSAGGVFAGVAIVFGGIIAVLAVLYLLTGWGLMGGKGWARIVGIILAVLGILGGLSALTGDSLAYGAVMTVLWALVAYALFTAGAFFATRR
jgi:hypothetical protein